MVSNLPPNRGADSKNSQTDGELPKQVGTFWEVTLSKQCLGHGVGRKSVLSRAQASVTARRSSLLRLCDLRTCVFLQLDEGRISSVHGASSVRRCSSLRPLIVQGQAVIGMEELGENRTARLDLFRLFELPEDIRNCSGKDIHRRAKNGTCARSYFLLAIFSVWDAMDRSFFLLAGNAHNLHR